MLGKCTWQLQALKNSGSQVNNTLPSHRDLQRLPALKPTNCWAHGRRGFRRSKDCMWQSRAASADRALASTDDLATESVAGDPISAVAAAVKNSERAIRLEVMVQIRKLYRNLLRAEAILETPTPVYTPSPKSEESEGEAGEAGRLSDAEQELIDDAVEIVAEMELTAEQLKIGLRALKCSPLSFGTVLQSPAPSEAEGQVEERVKASYKQLVKRASQEVAYLPFPSEAAAHAALEARNARFRGHVSWFPDPNDTDSEQAERPNLGERLGKAEKKAEEFIAKKVSAVKKVAETSPQGLLNGLKSGAAGLRDVWVRLNGGGRSKGALQPPEGLPLPVSSEQGRAERVAQLNLDIDALEKKLQDSSKSRESKLRKAGIQGRARMAGEIRTMDDEVTAISRELAVRTLQLEMEYIYGGLEEEALDIVGDSKLQGARVALGRRGSSDELALLVAEFAQLDEQLHALTGLVEQGEALFIEDAEVAQLAMDIPDMRSRLGIGDTMVFGGAGLGLVKVQLQLKEGVAKVKEGVNFGTRGVRLLASDAANAGRLFWRAVTGSTLKPREVQALRRTLKDLLTFIPFVIILIAPLTPVGHVLIFGFIQRYFPGLFPSQFSTKRQELMMKYEELKQQLAEAKLQAEIENDELEYQRAAAAVASVRSKASVAAAGPPQPRVQGATLAADPPSSAAPTVPAASAAAGAARAPPAPPPGSDEEDEGPAASRVRELQQKIEKAADASFSTDSE